MSNNQIILLSSEIMDVINRDCDQLIVHQKAWDRQSLVTGMAGFARNLLNGKYEQNSVKAPSPAPGTTVLKGVLQDIINSDQGPYEKLFNIKALLEVK